MDYKKITDELKKKKEKEFELTYAEIEEILGTKLPLSLTKHHGFTKKSDIGKAILSAGCLFDNSYKNELISFKQDEAEAKKYLKYIDIDSTKKQKNIFLNVIFPHSAKYVNDKGNIGHEIIDIFGADNEEYHYYLNPKGLVNENNIPDVIISICQVSVGLYKILNKAVVKRPEKFSYKKKKSDDSLYCKQKKTFLYNDKYLEDYFESNVGGNTVLSSFVCDGIYEPIKPLYIAFKTFKQNKLKENFYRLLSTSPGRTTFFFKFNMEDQNLLEKLVGDSALWNNKPIKSFKEYAKKYEKSDDFNYFSELGIEKQELQFSNAMKLFLEHFHLTNRFLEHLGCKTEKSDSFSI